jgi:hypothetical protein
MQQALHNVGARKLVLVGLGQIGCTPHAIATNGKNGLCAQKQNNDALIFSHKLRSLVNKFNIQHLDSKSIFINSTAGTLDSSLGKHFNHNFISCFRLIIIMYN